MLNTIKLEEVCTLVGDISHNLGRKHKCYLVK